jgi:hypothetical protein
MRVVLISKSWLSHRIIASTLALSLNSDLIIYNPLNPFKIINKLIGEKVIFFGGGNKSHVRVLLYYIPFTFDKMLYISSTAIFKYSLYHSMADNAGVKFIHPSRFHCDFMRKMGYKKVYHIPHAYPMDTDLPDDIIIQAIENRKYRKKFTLLSIFTSQGIYKGIEQYLKALELTKGNMRIIIKILDDRFLFSPPTNKEIIIYKGKVKSSRNDIINLILSSDLVVIPSLIEGFGMPIIESLRLGRPVLTLDAPPMNEINNKKVGYLVKIEKRKVIDRGECIDILNYPNITDFAEKIEEAVNDSNWEEKCFNAFQYAKNNFNPYVLYRKFLSI